MLIIGSIVYAAISYGNLPEKIPTHFNLKGEADDWGNKGTIFLMPLMILPSYMVMYFLSKSPDSLNLNVKVTKENAPRVYAAARSLMILLNFEIVVITAYITWGMVQAGKGKNTLGIGVWDLPLMIGIVLGTVVYFMWKMKRLK